MGASSTGPAASRTFFSSPAGRSGGLGRRIPLVVDHLQGAIQFLLGDKQRGIDRRALSGTRQRLRRVCLLRAASDRGARCWRRLRNGSFKGGAIAQVFGLKVVGLLVEVESSFKLLAGLGVLAFGVKIFCLVFGDREEGKSRPAAIKTLAASGVSFHDPHEMSSFQYYGLCRASGWFWAFLGTRPKKIPLGRQKRL